MAHTWMIVVLFIKNLCNAVLQSLVLQSTSSLCGQALIGYQAQQHVDNGV